MSSRQSCFALMLLLCNICVACEAVDSGAVESASPMQPATCAALSRSHSRSESRAGAAIAFLSRIQAVDLAAHPTTHPKPPSMHAIDLVDLAATSTQLALSMAQLRLPPRCSAAQDVWLTSRYRQDNWLHCLARHRDAIVRPNTSRRIQLWLEIMPVIHEVLLAEPLTRVIAYSAGLWSKRGCENDLSPLAHSSLAAHIEARNRCLHLIVFGQGLAVDQAAVVNRLRQNLEYFTDHLLARLPAMEHPGLYAFEPQALRRRQRQIRPVGCGSESWELSTQLHVKQLRQIWHRDLNTPAANARLNLQLSQHALGLFPRACFDSFGLPHSAASVRRLRTACDAQVGANCEHPLFKYSGESPAETQRLRMHIQPRRHRSD